MQAISDLVQLSTFIFVGTVLERGASAVPFVPAGENLLTVRLDRSLRIDPVLGDLQGKTITVAVDSAAQFTADQKVVFLANSWVHGRGIAVREVAHLDAGEADRVAAAVAQIPQRHLLDRLQDADVVVDALSNLDHPTSPSRSDSARWTLGGGTSKGQRDLERKRAPGSNVLLRDRRVASMEPDSAIS